MKFKYLLITLSLLVIVGVLWDVGTVIRFAIRAMGPEGMLTAIAACIAYGIRWMSENAGPLGQNEKHD